MDGKLFVLRPREDPPGNGVKRGWYTNKDEDWQVVFPEDGKGPKDCYYRVVTSIPNIHKQKYLIGPKIHGEEMEMEQDDEYFINCDCETTQSFIHFRIAVDIQGQFWLEVKKDDDYSSLETIQLNGEDVTMEKGAVSINFGDKITVNKDGKEVHIFRFDAEEKPYPTLAEGLTEEEYFFPGYIHSGLTVIFQEILSYLGTSDLKQARLVNHLWEEEATKIMLPKAKIRIDFALYEQEMQLSRLILLRFANQMGGYVRDMNHLAITLPVFDDCNLDPFSGTEANKLVHDFDRYFLNLEGFGGESVKSLYIEGETLQEDGAPLGKLWMGCLKKFPNLEQLSIHIDHRLNRHSQPNLSLITWPNLLTFKLSSYHSYLHHDDEPDEDLPGMREWIQGCINAMKGVKVLDITSFPHAHLFIEMMNRNNNDDGGVVNLPKLTQLSVNLEGPELSPHLLSHLGQMRKGILTSLNLRVTVDFVAPSDWKKLFQAQAPTLHNLDLYFGPELEEDSIIKMPSVFPSLIRLNIIYCSKELNISWGNGIPGELIDYHKTFPKLKDLSVTPSPLHFRKRMNVWGIFSEWDANVPLWNSFFGSRVATCDTLKSLTIPHLPEYMVDGASYYGDFISPQIIPTLWCNQMLKYIEEMKGITAIFPNVQNCWILNIKKMSDEPSEILRGLRNKIPVL